MIADYETADKTLEIKQNCVKFFTQFRKSMSHTTVQLLENESVIFV